MTQLKLSVEGMTCASCVGRVERALAGVSGVETASVNLATETAEVRFDAPASLDGLVDVLAKAGYPARTQEVIFDVEGMTCASCVGRVERALAGIEGVTSASVNLAAETATARFASGSTDIATLKAAIAKSGYTAAPREMDKAPDAAGRKETEARDLKHKLILAAALTLPVFAVEMGGHMIPAFHHWFMGVVDAQLWRMAQFVLTLVVLAVPGRVFFAKGVPALLRGGPDMNALVAMGAGAAFAYSTLVTFAPSLFPADARNVYFEAAAVICTLILLGRWLEARAKGRTGEAIRKLAGLAAKTARVERQGQTLEIPVDQVAVGETLHLRPGEKVAVDGVVLTGESHVDEAMISGEPHPVSKAQGARLVAGTVNGEGHLIYRAEKVGRDTMLAQIIRMVEDAQGAKLPIQSMVDRVTMVFVPVVMGIAALTIAAWLMFGPEPTLQYALVAGVCVLIIACPCAMGLATPTSIMVGTGRAAELGVLFRKGDAMQMLEGVRTVAFDKTGTLTQGRPDVTDLRLMAGDKAEVLALLAGAEAASEHPIARAVQRFAEAVGVMPAEATKTRAIAGHGLRAVVAGRAVLVGNARLMAREGVDVAAFEAALADFAEAGATPLLLAIDGQPAAALAVSDPLRPSAKATVAALQKRGLKTVMISGDTQAAVRRVADALGIDDVVAEVLPKDKRDIVARLRETAPVAFVGDGINDAPALAEADVGIAVGSGTDVAIESADVVLSSGDPQMLVTAISASHATMRNIRQNLFWAFAYNAALIPLAAGVFYPFTGLLLSPMIGAGAMALSSVFVVSNALRLRRLAAAA